MGSPKLGPTPMVSTAERSDGSKALLSAVRAVFGPRAIVQRCQVHKQRNVADHLPEHMRRSISSAMSKAYRSRDVAKAERILTGLANQLERERPSAAASLREGLDETHRAACYGQDRKKPRAARVACSSMSRA